MGTIHRTLCTVGGFHAAALRNLNNTCSSDAGPKADILSRLEENDLRIVMAICRGPEICAVQ